MDMTDRLKEVLKKYWGYESFLPLQLEAMACILGGRDSIVVLPTGGGKSLCFQVPAVVSDGLAIVISPLISLMKDQVDSLNENGVPAARLDSTLWRGEKNRVFSEAANGNLKLLYVSPERLVSDGFIQFLQSLKISFVAVDEAHCVSMWGHDFRPEYRQLGLIKELFPDTSVHGFTATATAQVRSDVSEQLCLDQPEILVGNFDRPNLLYKVQRRHSINKQVTEIIDRFPNESGIVYCLRRADVEKMAAELNEQGYRALPYHAGLDDEVRKKNQDAFIREEVQIVAATVAFGMGIDKSNVRYVIHTGMPKTLEHYQQESGRAGRDGLEAECTLFYTTGDFAFWRRIIEDMEPEYKEIHLRKLYDMYNYCTSTTCRHASLVGYFGQSLTGACTACDVCLGQLEIMEDSLVIAQKILSCIMRLQQGFGAEYTVKVLLGSQEKRIIENGHHNLSTYSLLSEYSKRDVRDWTEQLVAQGFAVKDGEFQVLKVSPRGWGALRGRETPRLLRIAKKKEKEVKRHRVAADSWEDVDQSLFQVLRTLRREIAQNKNIPPFIVFGDAALRDMARKQPRTLDAFLQVKGVGEKKSVDYGKAFLAAINDYYDLKGQY